MTWTEILAPIKESEYFTNLWETVKTEYSKSKCFPPPKQIFRALELTSFEDVKVVILGQDPYHNDYQANGLCFSVSESVAMPPSLRNIFVELESDLGFKRSKKELDDWAKQGVLLLNSTLTVRAHEANSHQKLNWEKFTDHIIKEISDKRENVVFVLWGAFAQKKSPLIDDSKHLILKAVHPSPLSAFRGFFGSKPFSAINAYLQNHHKETISWQANS